MKNDIDLPTLEAEVFAAAVALGEALDLAGMRLAPAESCTGGVIARAMTETAGSSLWFDRGFVTYTNEAKQQMLGVRPETLDAHGAVSEPVAAEMAAGALAHSEARMSIAVSGIAGPTGATSGKPVGTVCFGYGLCTRDGGDPLIVTETVRFDGDRVRVRLQSARYALRRALEVLQREQQDRPAVA